jgi:anti-sigma regulatory factor (Ser/Thr protein kinase)
LLQVVLMRHPHLLDALHLITDGGVRLRMGRCFRQHLRVLGSPAERLKRIRAAVEELAKTGGG